MYIYYLPKLADPVYVEWVMKADKTYIFQPNIQCDDLILLILQSNIKSGSKVRKHKSYLAHP